MRLTLRTLLAWMDQVLPADDQRTLGDKVAASSVAPRLIDRLRQAVAHPGIAAPRPDGRGLADDPNTVADYVDNVLPADRLEAFERICIESDMHLAEVASCHALLAETALHPAAWETIDDAGRRRLLESVVDKAAAIGAAIAIPTAPRQPPAPRSAEVKVPASRIAPLDHVARPLRPAAARRRPPFATWAVAVVAVLVLVALGGAFTWLLAGRAAGSREVAAAGGRGNPRAAAHGPPSAPAGTDAAVAARREPPSQDVAVVPADGAAHPDDLSAARVRPESAPHAAEANANATPVEPATPVHDENPAAGETARPAAPSPAANPAAATAANDTTGPDDPIPVAAPTPEPPPAVAAVRVPQGDALALVPPDSPPRAAVDLGVGFAAAAAPPAGGATPPPELAGQPPLVARPTDVHGVLLRRAAGERPSPWQAVAAGDALAVGDEVVAPPWCHPQFDFGGVTIRLEPGTKAVLSSDGDGTRRIEIVFGRAVARSDAAGVRLGVRAGGLVGVVTSNPGVAIGMEVELGREPGSDPLAEESWRRAAIVTTDGAAAWKQTAADGGPVDDPLAGIGPEALLPPRSVLGWSSAEPAVAAVRPAVVDRGWLRAGSTGDRIERAAVGALAVRLASGEPLDRVLADMGTASRAEHRMLAAATLAVLGDYGLLVSLLADETPGRRLHDRQWESLEALTVPLALARGANAAGRLRQAIVDRLPADKGDLAFAVVCGLPTGAAADEAAGRFIEALDDPSLFVRRFAASRLVAASGGRAEARSAYRADRSAALREEGVTWWRRRAERGELRGDGSQ